ncbi:MAG: YggT family protein [Armatimonadota bacterium]|nr:YggT family protein [Armatimonadota bacterium]MDR7421848.1 YggT family protein [Armatimonadota bacterium]MDR7457732.1 YggT family protein [Armatimonadota bacterium]MDR7497044.1 YggT family protein [Armatimonadota bacterium]MDR7512602.1 YggT family protein [Armatimonadota bacterium]
MPELIALVNVVFQVLYILVLARVLLSWVPGLGLGHPVVRAVHTLTAPILDPIRRVMPPVGGLDLSPILAFLVLALVRELLISALLAL